MKARLTTLLEEAKSLTNESEASNASIALIRIILQHSCISLAEWLVEQSRGGLIPSSLTGPAPLQDLRAPSDGTLLSSLAQLIVIAENCGWAGLGRNTIWYTEAATRPCGKFARNGLMHLENVIGQFIMFRNDGVSGHGIPGGHDIVAQLDTVAMAIERLGPVLPIIKNSPDRLELASPSGNVALSLLRVYGNQLVCYRKIKSTTSGRCVVRAQKQVSLLDREEITYESTDILAYGGMSYNKDYQATTTYTGKWNPLCIIPDRLTDRFTGRDLEISELTDWLNDRDSRACQIYGDGGLGKTTLVIEFLHRWLEGKIASSWQPELITFFTAKRTRWGLGGLETIKAGNISAVDAALDIIRGFEGFQLNRDWFSREPSVVIQRVATYLSELRIERDSHLLILDNTETMAEDDESIRALTREITELARRLGRVMITTRRREAVEALPIELKPFDLSEAVKFLQERGRDLGRKPVEQAGESSLRKYSDKLGNKPLLLEVFLQTLDSNAPSLEKAFERVSRMQMHDLGEFLFADAWMRMAARIKRLLLLMTKISDLHDDWQLKLCCIETGVTVVEASEALEQSRGIASVSRFDGRLQISFTSEFMRFCEERTVEIDSVVHPTESSVKTVKRRYQEFLRAASSQIRSRFLTAFRHPHARAAWVAFSEKRLDDCELYYEEAVLADPQNGLLFDRYAYFLFSERRYGDAKVKAVKATELEPADQETWFTRGVIEARLGECEQALRSLTRAEYNGKPKHLCLLQQAYAYLSGASPDKIRAKACLEESERSTPRGLGLAIKHLAEVDSVWRRYIGERPSKAKERRILV